MLKILGSYITNLLGFILMYFLFTAFILALFDCL
jgi:hypothetical protein